MSDLTIIDDRRDEEAKQKKVVTRSCNNCGNYQTCTVRTSMPQRMYDMSTHRPFKLSDQFVSPMACGGELWREIEANDSDQIVKQDDETWKQFYARRDAARSKPQLTELP